MRILLLTSLALWVGAVDLAAQMPDLREFHGQRVSHARVVRLGASRAWFGAADRKDLKRRLRRLASLRPAPTRVLDLRRPIPVGVVAGGASMANAATAEREYNDRCGYASDLGVVRAETTIVGRLSTAADVDTFRFELATDGVLRIRTSYSGSRPWVVVTNATGDESWGAHTFAADAVVLPLPKGVYHLRLGGAKVASSYSMNCEVQAQALPALGLGQTTKLVVGPDQIGLRVVLPQDGRLRLDFTTANLADAYLVLHHQDFGYVYEVDDTSLGGMEPGLDAVLPRGTYYLYVGADKPATSLIRASFTAAAVPALGTSANGRLALQGAGFELYKITLSRAEELRLAIRSRGSAGIKDSYLQLFDRRMHQILEADDDSGSTLSSIGVSLPAGVYYVAVTGYHGRGDYTITRGTGPGSILPIRAGVNASASLADRAASLRFRLQTPARVGLSVAGGSGYDAQLAVLDASSGLSLAWEDDDRLGAGDSGLGMRLPAGDYYLIVKNYDGVAGAFTAMVEPPLQLSATNQVRILGHRSRLAYLLLATRLGTPGNPLPGVLTGKLLLDLSVMQVGSLRMPWTGIVDLPTVFPAGQGLFLQMVMIDTSGPVGEYSNLLR